MCQHAGTINITGGLSYADWVKLQNASSNSSSVSVHPVAPVVGPNVVAPTTDIVITETLSYDSDRTEMRAVFILDSNGKYTMTYEAKLLNHSSTSKIDNWTKRIRAILEGKSIQSVNTPSYWSDDSELTFLKVACLCNRVDDVQKVFKCDSTVVDAAEAWARGYGIVHTRTWLHSDELTIRGHKLTFTLQKWSDSPAVICIEQTIRGKDRSATEELSTILRDIIRWANNGNHCQHAQYSDLYARVAIFADAVSTYKLLLNRSSEDLALAKKYESKRMIEHLTTTPVREWTVSDLAIGGHYTLTKKDSVVTCAQLADTIVQVRCNSINLYRIQGGPQMWAEIAAFADNAQALTTARNFANHLGVQLDNKRITDAANAGKMA